MYEKGETFHEVIVHSKAEEYVDAYLGVAKMAEDRKRRKTLYPP